MRSEAVAEENEAASEEAIVVETDQRVGFRTGLINDTVLSIQYQWWASGGAHPIYGFKGFTIELASGYVFHFEDLFKSHSLYIPVINELILRSLREKGHGFSDFTRKRSYDFYLTKKNLVLFNLFTYEAARGVEALIKPKDLTYLISPNSPLVSILAV